MSTSTDGSPMTLWTRARSASVSFGIDRLARRVEHEEHHPLGPRPDADERPRPDPVVLARRRVPVQDAGTMRAVRREVGLEPDVRCLREPVLALERQPGQLDDAAAAAVGAHDVLRADRDVALGVPIADDRRDAVGVLLQRHELVAEADLADARLLDRLVQHRAEDVLRAVAHRRRARGAVVGGARRARPPRLEPRELAPREARRPHVVRHELGRRGDVEQPVLDAEVAADLDRPLVDDVGARAVRGARVLLDEQVRHTVARQGQGGREAGRAGADDEDRRGDVGHHATVREPQANCQHFGARTARNSAR